MSLALGQVSFGQTLMTYASQKTKMTMENQPFEDVLPIENEDFPVSS